MNLIVPAVTEESTINDDATLAGFNELDSSDRVGVGKRKRVDVVVEE